MADERRTRLINLGAERLATALEGQARELFVEFHATV